MADQNASKLFREESLEALAAPDELTEYLQVTSPGAWLILCTMLVLLLGVLVWGIFGHMTATVKVAVIASAEPDSAAVCLVPESAIKGALENCELIIDGQSYALSADASAPVVITENTDVALRLAGSLSVGDIVYEVSLQDSLEPGICSGSVVTETVRPISLLTN